MALTPLANILVKEEFKMGESLVKEGEFHQKFMVIASGHCKAMVERGVEARANPSNKIKGRIAKQRRFDFGKNPREKSPINKDLCKGDTPEEYLEGYINSVDPASKSQLNPTRFFENETTQSSRPDLIKYTKHVKILLTNFH